MNYKNIKKELDRLSMKYQAGGKIDERGRKIMDKGARQNFNTAVQFEKEYLLGNKAKERLLNLGLDPKTEIPTLWNRLSTVTLGVDNGSGNDNGAYYSDVGNAIKYSNESPRNVDSDTMNHEVGHIFGRANIRNSDMIDDRNAFVDQSTLGGLWQKVKNTFSSDYNAGEGHEADWQELVADVHAARQELVGTGYDGRTSNFTNEAYNSMRRYANQMPDSASGRLFFKVGTPETSKYRMLKTQMEYQKIPLNKLPKEDQDFIQDYEKNKKKYEDTQKRYMFDVMNKIVSNAALDEEVVYAQSGGKVNSRQIDINAKKNFLESIQFEKEYLNSNKIKQRMLNSGLDPNTEIPELKRLVNTANLSADNGDYNSNGAYYDPFNNEISYTNIGPAASYGSSLGTMSHEVGHIFDDVNSTNRDFVSDRNTYASQSTIGRAVQGIRRNFNDKWYSGAGHETSPDETIADVHALRKELYPTGYDGRTTNFTNEAYNSMRRIAKDNPSSVSARMLEKIGTPQMKYYNSILNKTMDELTPEDEAFLKRYDKDRKSHENTQKKFIFEIMNKIVSNNAPNNNIDFAKLGGLIKMLKIENKRN